MKKSNIVKKKYEFDDIIKTGKSVRNNFYIIYFKENQVCDYRFGISVGKKLGNAVFRNKYKRKIRNIIDNNKKYYQKKLDYIIIMRRECVDSEYIKMNQEYIELINIINRKGDFNEKRI